MEKNWKPKIFEIKKVWYSEKLANSRAKEIISIVTVQNINSGNKAYSIIRQRGKCSRKYSKSSWDAPGQLVSSNSCKCLNWIMLDKPLDVSNGQPKWSFSYHIVLVRELWGEEIIPARDRTCKFRIEHKCCRPKSRTCVHQRRNNVVNESMVEM